MRLKRLSHCLKQLNVSADFALPEEVTDRLLREEGRQYRKLQDGSKTHSPQNRAQAGRDVLAHYLTQIQGDLSEAAKLLPAGATEQAVPVEAPKKQLGKNQDVFNRDAAIKELASLEGWLDSADVTDPEYDRKSIQAQLLAGKLKSDITAKPEPAKPAGAAAGEPSERVGPTTLAPLTVSPYALHIAAPMPGAKSIWKATGRITAWLKKWMTSAGNMPQEGFTLDRRRIADIAKNEKQLSYETTAIRDALLKTSGSTTLSPAGVDTLNSAIRSDPTALAALHPEVRQAVQSAREHLDSLSRRAIDNGLAADDLEMTFDKNIGVYINRSYQVHDDPKWHDKVKAMPQVWNKAHALLKQQNPSASDEQIDNLMSDMVTKDGVSAYIAGRRVGSKDLSIIKPRSEIPPEIRALLGEYKDPFVNITKSITKLAHLTANHEFLTNVREAGMGKFFFQKDDPKRAGAHIQIAADSSSVMAPLNGLYTFPEVKEAFDNVLISPIAGQDLPSWLFRQYSKAMVFGRYGKTVLNIPQGWARNFLSNPLLLMRDGHFGWLLDPASNKSLPASMGVAAQDVRSELPDFLRQLYPTNKAWQERNLRHIELGLGGGDVNAGDLRAAINDAINPTPADLAANPLMQVIRKGGSAAAAGYQAMDTPWRRLKFELELARRKRAFETAGKAWDQEAQEHEAADITNRTFTTYSLIPAAMKSLRRIPLAGSFTSFSSEIIRSQYHSLLQSHKELNDPVLRKIGVQRLVGNAIALSLPATITAIWRMLAGLSRDDDKDFREFLPPWSENSDLLWLYKGDDGHSPAYVDLSYTTPNSIFLKPTYALMSGDNWEESFWGAAKEFGGPFVGPDMLTTAIGDALWNKTRVPGGSSRQVYNEQGSLGTKARDVAEHIWKSAEPGSITSARRLGKAVTGFKAPSGRGYSTGTELLSATGFRAVPVDIQQSLSFAASSYAKADTEATGIFSNVYGSRGTVGAGEVSSAYKEADESKRRLFDDMARKVSAAIRLGVPEDDVKAVLKASGLSDENAKELGSGKYLSYVPSAAIDKRGDAARRGELQAALPPEASKAYRDQQLAEAVTLSKHVVQDRPKSLTPKEKAEGKTLKQKQDAWQAQRDDAKAKLATIPLGKEVVLEAFLSDLRGTMKDHEARAVKMRRFRREMGWGTPLGGQ